MDNLEFLIEPEAAIKEYFTSKNLLYLLLLMNMLSELLICYYFLMNENDILRELDAIYRFWHFEEQRMFYEALTKIITAVNLLVYSFGVYSVWSHKVTNY